MIRIQQLKLPITHNEEQLLKKLAKTLHVKPEDIMGYKICRQSIDARKKHEVCFVYTVDAHVRNEQQVLRRAKGSHISQARDVAYCFPQTGKRPLQRPPVVIGSGPAGLFCAYLLAEHGFCPLILERGKPVEERAKEVENFWQNNILNPCTNVQFGEGGAGTFSDGKLNTLVKDAKGRNKKVLEIFIRHGAPAEISYQAKPHIGTDILKGVIRDMRRQIEAWGGTYLFNTCVTDLKFSDGKLAALVCQVQENGNVKEMEAELAVLAVGHLSLIHI